MRKSIALAVVLCSCWSDVFAATIYLRWSGEAGDTIELSPGGVAEVELWMDLIDGESLSGLFYTNTSTNALRQIDTEILLNGWSDGSLDGLLGNGTQQIVFTSDSSGVNLTDAGAYLIGKQTIRLETCVPNAPIALTIDHGSLHVYNATASQPTWDARYNTSYAGYIAYGDYGNPGWGTKTAQGHQPTSNPLYAQCVPQPLQSNPDWGQCENCNLPSKALDLLAEFPGLWVYTNPHAGSAECATLVDPGGCSVAALYGRPMTEGATPEVAVELWLADWAEPEDNVFGVDGLDLRLVRSNAVGAGNFTVFAYRQYIDDLAVEAFGMGLARIVVAHTKPPTVVYASGHLASPPSGGLRTAEITAADAVAVVQAMPVYEHLSTTESPVIVVHAGGDGRAVRAWRFVGSGHDPQTDEFEAYRFFVDAADGTLLGAFSTIHDSGVSGQVKGYVTPGMRAYDPGDTLKLVELEGVEIVGTNGELTRTGAGGNFLLHTDANEVTINTMLATPWARIYDFQTAEVLAEQPVQASAHVDLVLNESGDEFTTTKVNALYQVTKTYRFFKDRQPGFLGLDYPLRVNVNIAPTTFCGAFFYDGPVYVIQFEAAGTCPNGGFSTFVAHEYGHSIHFAIDTNFGVPAEGGVAFYEGFADAVSILTHDDPIIGRDAYVLDYSLRDYRCHQIPYPCPYLGGGNDGICNDEHPAYAANASYACGMTLGGSWWHIKCQIEGRLGKPAGLEVARQLFTDWSQVTIGPRNVLGKERTSATPLTVIEVLLANDLANGSATLADGTPDDCAICRGYAAFGLPCPPILTLGDDANSNGVPDRCEDCNGNAVNDGVDITGATSLDCNSNGVPDECEPDCNGSGVPDDCDISAGSADDDNSNGIPDLCDAAADCNTNGIADSQDIVMGTSLDCNSNGVPDDCEPSCNGSRVPDDCLIIAGTSSDCTSNGIPDVCEPDCNSNALPDSCDIFNGLSRDCNGNGIPDECELAAGSSADCDTNDVPDECDLRLGDAVDCNNNGVPDKCELEDNDCNFNEIPDDCDLLLNIEVDCNSNGVPDACDIAGSTSSDADTDGVPDECLPAPRVVSIASVGYHAPFGGWTGDEIELCIDPDRGAIEPRRHAAPSSHRQLYLKVTFDRPIDPASLSSVRLLPDKGLRTNAKLGSYDLGDPSLTDPRIVSIDFRYPGGADTVEVSSGSYRVDISDLRAVNGGRAGGARATFPICYLPGDANQDGEVNVFDWSLGIFPFGSLDLGEVEFELDPFRRLADLDRDGRISASIGPSGLYIGGEFNALIGALWENPPQPVTCTPACNLPNQCSILDCNNNGQVDPCDIADEISEDCDGDLVPDECSDDCNSNSIWDACEVFAGSATDCNENDLLDECDIALGSSTDLNSNNLPDECEDCNLNGIPDDMDIAEGTSTDVNDNDIPDDCERDCNTNGVPDIIECFENDYDRDGDADLEDFAAYQRCVSLEEITFDCAAFSHCDTNGALDFPAFRDAASNGFVTATDFFIQPGPHPPCYGEELLAMLLGGGDSGMSMMMGEGSGFMDSLGGDDFSSPATLSANLSITLHPVGGGTALTVLEPFTAYELHYVTDASSVGFYVAYLVIPDDSETEPSLSFIEDGAWLTETAMYLSASSEGDSSPFFGIDWNRTVGLTNGFWGLTDEAAPASGLLLIIDTGAEGVIGVEVSMGYVDPLTSVMTTMEQTAVFAVKNVSE